MGGPRYMKPGQDFDFGSVKGFGFSGSAQGRHDALNQNPPDDNEFGDGGLPDKGYAKGGRTRGTGPTVAIVMPHADPVGQSSGIPPQKVAGALKGAAILGAKVGARVGAKAAPALGGGMGAPAIAPMGGPPGGGPMAGVPGSPPPAGGALGLKRGGHVKKMAMGGSDMQSYATPQQQAAPPSPGMAKGGPVGGDSRYDSSAEAAISAQAPDQYKPSEKSGYAEGGEVAPNAPTNYAKGSGVAVPTTMAEGGKLTSAKRHALQKGEFALPGGRYPINDPNHARNALARVSGNGTPSEKASVRAAVHRKYPGIGKK